MVCLRLDFNPLSLTYFSFLSLPHPMIDFYRAFEQELLPGPVTVLLNRKKSASISVSCVLAFLIFVKNIFSLFRGCWIPVSSCWYVLLYYTLAKSESLYERKSESLYEGCQGSRIWLLVGSFESIIFFSLTLSLSDSVERAESIWPCCCFDVCKPKWSPEHNFYSRVLWHVGKGSFAVESRFLITLDHLRIITFRCSLFTFIFFLIAFLVCVGFWQWKNICK